MLLNDKWVKGAIPALLIHISIGIVYCWSILKFAIAKAITYPIGSLELTFALTIFFLGMSAAFGGKFVEHNVKLSTELSGILYLLGFGLSVLAIIIQNILLFYLAFGVILGIGVGIGYISPIKTLMLWFKNNKGLATGLAIAGFGLSKTIYSPIIVFGLSIMPVTYLLGIIGLIGGISILYASNLIQKPEVESKIDSNINIFDVIFTSKYIKLWLIFFINITCGLSIIAFEKEIIGVIYVVWFSIIAAISNAGGRLVYAKCTDILINKYKVYYTILITSIIACIGYFISPLFVIPLIIIVNLGYGGGFASMPNIVQDEFGMNNVSTIHGYILSAWAFASITSYLLSQFFIYYLCISFGLYVGILGIIYLIALFIVHEYTRNKKI